MIRGDTALKIFDQSINFFNNMLSFNSYSYLINLNIVGNQFALHLHRNRRT